MKKVQVLNDRIIKVTVLILFILFLSPIMVNASIQKQVIRIGYVPNYCVITDPDADIEKGYGYEYFTEIAKYTDWVYEYIPCGWSEGIEMLENGQIDILGPMGKNPERAEKYSFPKNEMGQEYGGLFIHSDNELYNFDDAKSFDGMRIGTDKNNFFNHALEDYCIQNDINVQIINTDVRNYAVELKQGKYDAVVNSSMLAIPETMLAVKLSLEPYYFVTEKDNKVLSDQLDEALEKIELEDLYFAAKLYDKYYKHNPVNIPAFTKDEKLFIKQNSVIKVVGDTDWASITYCDEQGSSGISVDVLRILGDISGLNFEFVPTKSYLESKQMLKEGQASLMIPRADSAADLGVTYTKAFHEVSTMLVGLGEIDVNQPLQVGVVGIHSAQVQSIMKQYPHFQMMEYADTEGLLNAFHSGNEKYIFVSSYIYDAMVRSEGGDLHRAVPMDITYPLRFGVSKDRDPILLELLNKSIGRLSENEINSIVFANTVNRAYQMPLSRLIRENMFLVLTVLALLFICLVFIITVVNRMNRKKLECFAFVDELTGLPTLAKFRLNAVESVKNSKESDFLLITLDIDNFKYINDVFGYEMGNQLLKCIADHFLKFPFAYRHIGRIFADQFIFLVSATQKEEAISNFHAMLNISEEMQDLFPVAYNLVLSAGIYVLSDPDEAFASCCDKANMARKTVKGRHLTMLREYTTEMDDKMNWKKDITLSMEDALEQGDFQVYLQPKYRFSNECLAGAEALVRWQHTQMGMLLPFSFITLFEQNGFILKLDYYMFEQVCILIRNWIDRGLKVVPISVNLSRLHLANPHLVEELANIAEQYNIPEGMIEIELTESIVLDDSNMLIKIMKKLKEVGFDISVDDFGSGYSSLYLLTDLPVDVLKLDKGFLKKMTEGGNSRLIVEQVVELAKKLHLSIVAEGVETKEQVDFLRCLGCDLAQGYYFAKPMPYQEYEKILEETSTFI